MKQDRFWCVNDSSLSDARFAWWVEGEVDFAQVTCPLNEFHMRPGARTCDLSIVLPNKPVQDFVWTWMNECLIQDHVLGIFRSRGVTGFQVKPVRARFERPGHKPLPVLWELVVTGWGGMAAEASGIKLKTSCEGCGMLRYTDLSAHERLLDESQWDGSDVFMVWPLPKFRLVTARVADLIRERRFSGATLTPISKINSLFGSTPGFGPGRLSYWMPKERAKQLGAPLGID